MRKFRFNNLIDVIIIAVLGIIGMLVAASSLVEACKENFISVERIILRALYLLAYLNVFIYVFGLTKSSRGFFTLAKGIYAIIIMMTGIVFTQDFGGDIADKLAVISNVIILGALIRFEATWKNFSSARVAINLCAFLDLATCIWFLVACPDLVNASKPFFVVNQCLLRPFIGILIASCYNIRMSEKYDD